MGWLSSSPNRYSPPWLVMMNAVFLGVESVARHEGAGEFDGSVMVEEALGDGQFAIILFAAVGALGEGLAGGAAMVLVEGGAFLPDGFDVVGSADEAVNDEGEHGVEGVADGFGVAGVGES